MKLTLSEAQRIKFIADSADYVLGKLPPRTNLVLTVVGVTRARADKLLEALLPWIGHSGRFLVLTVGVTDSDNLLGLLRGNTTLLAVAEPDAFAELGAEGRTALHNSTLTVAHIALHNSTLTVAHILHLNMLDLFVVTKENAHV